MLLPRPLCATEPLALVLLGLYGLPLAAPPVDPLPPLLLPATAHTRWLPRIASVQESPTEPSVWKYMPSEDSRETLQGECEGCCNECQQLPLHVRFNMPNVHVVLQ